MKLIMRQKVDKLLQGLLKVAPQKTNSHNPDKDHVILNNEKYSHSTIGEGVSNTGSYNGNFLANEKKYK